MSLEDVKTFNRSNELLVLRKDFGSQGSTGNPASWKALRDALTEDERVALGFGPGNTNGQCRRILGIRLVVAPNSSVEYTGTLNQDQWACVTVPTGYPTQKFDIPVLNIANRDFRLFSATNPVVLEVLVD